MNQSPHFQALAEIIGSNNILSDAAEMQRYTSGARGDHGTAAFVLRPKTTEETSKIISYCVKNKIHLIPQSGNTGLVNGSIPDSTGAQAVLSFDRMSQIFSIDPDNKSAHIGAGCRLSALNTATQAHDLYFPVDLSSDPCISGMCATNTGGGRFLKFGGVRENTLGLKIVLADEHGTILDLTNPLHKNNTGLDLKQIFIGTSGAFGIITECVVKLAPCIKQTATALLIPSNVENVMALLRIFESQCGAYLSAFEGMSGEAMTRALHHAPALINPFGRDTIPDFAILVELTRTWDKRESEQSLDDVLENVLATLWEGESALLENALIGDPVKLWALRHAISEGVQKSGKLFAFDISFRRGDVMRFRQTMKTALPAAFPDITICDFGHIGDGGVHFNLVVKRDDPRLSDPTFEDRLRHWMLERVVKDFNGSFSAEHALGRKNQSAYNLYTQEDIQRIARNIKSITSPADIGTVVL